MKSILCLFTILLMQVCFSESEIRTAFIGEELLKIYTPSLGDDPFSEENEAQDENRILLKSVISPIPHLNNGKAYDLKEKLESLGVKFPKGGYAYYFPDQKLVVAKADNYNWGIIKGVLASQKVKITSQKTSFRLYKDGKVLHELISYGQQGDPTTISNKEVSVEHLNYLDAGYWIVQVNFSFNDKKLETATRILDGEEASIAEWTSTENVTHKLTALPVEITIDDHTLPEAELQKITDAFKEHLPPAQ